MGEDKTIRITCKGAGMVEIETLDHFQGNLKTLADKEYQKLRAAIEKHGFSFPVFAWKNEEHNYIIDGHQRLFTVRKMVSEGWTLPDNLLPIDWIEASSKKEAKEKVLLAASQYGKIDMDNLFEYIQTEGLDFSDLEGKMDLPQIDMEKFKYGFFEDKDPAFVDNDQLINKFSIWIKCTNKEEQDEVMSLLNLTKPKIYFKDFLEGYSQKGDA